MDQPPRLANGRRSPGIALAPLNTKTSLDDDHDEDNDHSGHDSFLSSPTYYDESNDSDRAPLFKGKDDEDTDDLDEKVQAALANDAETSMTLWEGLRKYPKAVAWSVGISTCIIMEGYDTALLGGFYGYPSFQRKYGKPFGAPDPITGYQHYQIPAYWASIMPLGTTFCTLAGLAINGWATEKYGYRPVILVSLIAISLAIAVPFFSQNMTVLFIGEMLCAIPWGIFQTLTTAYASEVCPVVLRCYLTTYVNMAWVIGMGLSNITLRILVDRQDEWAFRIPFAMQWIWPVPLFIAALYAPESPWWLIREGRIADAEASVRRLCSSSIDVRNTISMMKHTNKLEALAASRTGTSTYGDCFRGTNARRTEIASVVWMIQMACGISFVNWGSYFLQVAGMSPEDAYSLTVANSGTALVGTISSWILMTYFGRRTLYMSGLMVMVCIFVAVGGFSFVPTTPATVSQPHPGQGIAITTAILFNIFHLTYGLTVGPVCYTIVSEIPSTRLRAKTVTIARAAYVIIELFCETLTPMMVQETGWNWKYKTGWFWTASCALMLCWCFWRLPEPKGRSYGELAVLFARRVPARLFARAVVDPFEARKGEEVDMGTGGVEDGQGRVSFVEEPGMGERRESLALRDRL